MVQLVVQAVQAEVGDAAELEYPLLERELVVQDCWVGVLRSPCEKAREEALDVQVVLVLKVVFLVVAKGGGGEVPCVSEVEVGTGLGSPPKED